MGKPSYRVGAFLLMAVLLFASTVAIAQETATTEEPEVTEEMIADLESQISDLKAQLEELRASEEELQGKVESNGSSIAALEKKESEVSAEVDKLKGTVEDQDVPGLRKELTNLTKGVESMNGKLNRLKAEADERDKVIGDLSSDLKSTGSELNQLEKINSTLEELESNLQNVRESAFNNERRLASLEKTYEDSARRNLLVAASGIVVGLLAITLHWT